MKLKNLFTFAAAALMLASCNNSTQNSSDLASATAKGDSLVYCFGQLRGAEFMREALKDSALNTPATKQEYLRGIKAGLDVVKADKEAYNRGLYIGMQMAMNFSQFEKDYGVRLSDKEFLKGVSEAINSDSTVNTSDMQATFYRIMNEFSKEKEQRDKAAASEALKKAGEDQKLQQISENLWGNASADTTANIKDGDKVKIDLKVTNLKGKSIETPFPKELKVGQRMNTNPITEAVKTLASGQTGNFLTSAQALLGARCAQVGLEPSEVLKIEVTPTIVEETQKPE